MQDKGEHYKKYKNYIFSIAYQVTGEVSLAEDLAQETFEKWSLMEAGRVENPKAYLARMVVHKSMDALKLKQKERQAYKGLWLPEPLLTAAEENTAPDIDYAILFILENLNPAERAVFVLREVFDHPYAEIADLVNTTEANCRQLYHRAKEKVKKPLKKTSHISKQQELLEAFLVAAHQNNLEKLKEIFREDISYYADGGGRAAAALKPLYGMDKVLKFIAAVTDLQRDMAFSAKPVLANGKPAVILYGGGVFHSLVYVETDGERISEIYTLRNPEKISEKF